MVILDSNVIFSALKSSKGYSFELINLLRAGKFSVALTPPLLFEYEDLLKRPGYLRHLTPDEIDGFLDWFTSISRLHRVYYLWRPVLSDPKDDLVLEAAVSSSSTHIVTFNGKHFRPAGSFGVSVLEPADFINQIVQP